MALNSTIDVPATTGPAKSVTTGAAKSVTTGAAKRSHRVTVGDFKVSERELEYLNQALAGNQISYGPLSEQFESRIAELHGARFGLFMNSGTSALHVALAALKQVDGWADWDEVIVPATTFVATANVVFHNRLTPVFVDVDPLTFNIDTSKVESRITSRTRCIIPVHLLGLPADMDPIAELARRYGLRVIEDSCEAMFVRYKGKPVGGIGDIGCFSTYVAHYIVTGVGGVAITSDARLASAMRSLMNHGRDGIYISAMDDKGLPKDKFLEVVSRRFKFESLGHSFRATELQAALGLGQLDIYEEILKSRISNARYLQKSLTAITDKLQFQFVPPDREHSYMLFGIKIRGGSKHSLIEFLELKGIETRDLLPLVNQPVYRTLGIDFQRSSFPVSFDLVDSAFYIGCHQYLDQSDLDWVVSNFDQYFGGQDA